MKIGTRLLLGTLATTAALGGGTASAHATATSPSPAPSPSTKPGANNPGSLDMDSMLCPVASSGVIGTVLDRLNHESIDRSCGGLHKSPAGSPLGLL